MEGIASLAKETYELCWWTDASDWSLVSWCHAKNTAYLLPQSYISTYKPYTPWPESQHVIWGELSHTERLRRRGLGRVPPVVYVHGGWACWAQWYCKPLQRRAQLELYISLPHTNPHRLLRVDMVCNTTCVRTHTHTHTQNHV